VKFLIQILPVAMLILGLKDISASTTTREVEQFGIKWTFSKPVEFGKFVTGEYYVVDPGGGVTITSVSPSPSGGRNGSMLNPVPSKDWVAANQKQGYDNRIPRFDNALSVSFPATLTGGNSLVSTESLTSADLDPSGLRYTASWQSKYTPSKDHVQLKSAAVLTVLSSRPPPGSFRPPFVGTAKPLYNVSKIQRKYLRRLPAPGVAPSRPLSYFERGLERPWINHGYWTEALYLHPTENMLHYHQYIGEFLSEASLIMLTTLSTEKLELNFIQRGIDMYHTVILGPADQAYFEWQVMYTGLLLGEQNMINASKNGTATPGRASEKVYYWDGRRSGVKSSIVPEGQTWTGARVFFRKQVGAYEYEHLHPSEWGKAVANSGEAAANGGAKSEKYRQGQDSIPHMGMALTSRILGATSLWRNQALDDYLTRWMTEDWTNKFKPVVDQHWSGIPNYTRTMGSAFNDEMWRLYKSYTISGEYQPPPQAAQVPIATPPSGSYSKPQSVALSTATVGGKIYYTIDGTEPTTASRLYSSPILMDSNKTLKAITEAPGYAASELLTSEYIILPDGPFSVTSAGWSNVGFTRQTGPMNDEYEFELIVIPGFDSMDGVIGLSDGPVAGNPSGYYQLAVAIRLSTTGRFEAYNGNTYQSDRIIAYRRSTSYRVKIRVNTKQKTYDVWVNGTMIADDYEFRADLRDVAPLNNLAGFASIAGTSFSIDEKITSSIPHQTTWLGEPTLSK
jgi:hypothetical protein